MTLAEQFVAKANAIAGGTGKWLDQHDPRGQGRYEDGGNAIVISFSDGSRARCRESGVVVI